MGLFAVFELVSATRNSNDVITTANIKWPDGATGTFTATTINNTFNTIDAWQATHILSGDKNYHAISSYTKLKRCSHCTA